MNKFRYSQARVLQVLIITKGIRSVVFVQFRKLDTLDNHFSYNNDAPHDKFLTLQPVCALQFPFLVNITNYMTTPFMIEKQQP